MVVLLKMYGGKMFVKKLTFEYGTKTMAKFYVKGSGVKNGGKTIIQHNSAGIAYITDFEVNSSDTLYSSCSNCRNGYQGKREVVMNYVTTYKVNTVVGINKNYGDRAILKNVTAKGSEYVCQLFRGNHEGKEPVKLERKCKSGNRSSCNC